MNANLDITVLNHNTIEVSLPEGLNDAFPSIPRELHGRKIPLFVLDWLLETDEVGFMIQETLQAPTRSMCRIYYMGVIEDNPKGLNPTDKIGKPNDKVKIGDKIKKPLTPIIKSPAKGIKKDGLKGHSRDTFLQGLPKGIVLPVSLENHPNIPERVTKWIENGRNVRKWLESEGLDDVSWLEL